MENIIVKQIPYTHNKETDKIVNERITALNESIPYGVSIINASYMWNKGITGKNVTIAVIDTGCDLTHPDLKNQIVEGRNFTYEDRCTGTS